MPVTVQLNSQILQKTNEHFLVFRKCLWLLNFSADILKHHHKSNSYYNQAIPGASNSKLIFGHFQTQIIQSIGLGGPPRRRALPLLPFFLPPEDPLTVVAAKAAANASPRLVGWEGIKS